MTSWVLACYTSGILAVVAVPPVVAITVPPGREGALQKFFLALAGTAALVAVIGWVLTELLPKHRWPRSWLVRKVLSLAAAAVLATLLVMVFVRERG